MCQQTTAFYQLNAHLAGSKNVSLLGNKQDVCKFIHMRGLVDIARTKGKKSERTIRQVVVILALKYFSQATSTEKTTRKHVVVRQVGYNGLFCLWVIMHPHTSVTFYSIRRILDSSPSEKRAHEEKKRDGRENQTLFQYSVLGLRRNLCPSLVIV